MKTDLWAACCRRSSPAAAASERPAGFLSARETSPSQWGRSGRAAEPVSAESALKTAPQQKIEVFVYFLIVLVALIIIILSHSDGHTPLNIKILFENFCLMENCQIHCESSAWVGYKMTNYYLDHYHDIYDYYYYLLLIYFSISFSDTNPWYILVVLTKTRPLISKRY